MENLLTVSLHALSHHGFFHGVSFISTRLKNGYYSPNENNNKQVEREARAKTILSLFLSLFMMMSPFWRNQLGVLCHLYSLRLNRRNKTVNELTFYSSKCARGLAQEQSLPPHFPWSQT